MAWLSPLLKEIKDSLDRGSSIESLAMQYNIPEENIRRAFNAPKK